MLSRSNLVLRRGEGRRIQHWSGKLAYRSLSIQPWATHQLGETPEEPLRERYLSAQTGNRTQV